MPATCVNDLTRTGDEGLKRLPSPQTWCFTPVPRLDLYPRRPSLTKTLPLITQYCGFANKALAKVKENDNEQIQRLKTHPIH